MAGRAKFVAEKLTALYADRSGATAIEYGLIIAIISSAVIFGLGGIRDNLNAVFRLISDTFANATV